jgi:hypothetical protein
LNSRGYFSDKLNQPGCWHLPSKCLSLNSHLNIAVFKIQPN